MRVAGVVIAGGGLAGLRTAEELRAAGYDGEITLIGAERRPPYDRPPLSKRFLAGEVADTTLPMDPALGLAPRLGEAATGLAEGVLRTDRAEYPFGALVIATGAVPVRLPGPGPQRVLRTMDDAAALRAALRPGVRLAIAGAGWVGAELATEAARRGCQVTVLDPAPAPLATALGPEVGARTAPWYEAAGVTLRLGERVSSVEPGGLALAGGRWLAADEVVTAVGVRPATGWLRGGDPGGGSLAAGGPAGGGGLELAADGAVVTDAALRASVPGVFAAGDCASFPSARFRRRLRVEHWDNALRAPAVVAAGVMGREAAYDPVPYFWSEQFGRMLQYAGAHTSADRLLWRGDPAGPEWAACWVAAGRGGVGGGTLQAVLTVNRPRDLRQGTRLIAAGAVLDERLAADPDVPLRECVTEGDR